LEPLTFGWKPEARPSNDKWAECTSNRLKPVSCAETSNRTEQTFVIGKDGMDGWLIYLLEPNSVRPYLSVTKYMLFLFFEKQFWLNIY
jgi:hypothetical protein